MIAVGITLKSLYPKLFHVTCVAHLLHNCAMKIKSYFEDEDQLIAKAKAVALYYAKYLPEVKAVVENFVGSGILISQAKVRLQKSALAGQLLKIKDQYECLVKLIEKMESAKYTITEAVQAIQELDFVEDTCNINQYIKKRMQNNDISEIINMERQDISPAVYHMLENFQPTSASVERSFSMLQKLLAKDRNFRSKCATLHDFTL